MTNETAKLVSPRLVLAQVADAVPSVCRENIIVIGSLAAGFQLLGHDDSLQVRTKDIDCVLSPRVKAVKSGRAVAQKLLAEGWKPREEGEHGKPGNPPHLRTVCLRYGSILRGQAIGSSNC